MEYKYLILLLLPLIAYAEIHYRLLFWPSLLFKREPEIIFDISHRSSHKSPVALFLFIKDAHRYAIHLCSIKVYIRKEGSGESSIFQEEWNHRITTNFYSHTIWIPADFFPDPGEYRIITQLHYHTNAGKKRSIQQDNYRGIPHNAFSINITDSPLPRFPNWYWGDLHVHSNYTEDQVEFGAPIEATVQAARSIGLDFIAITDHSYDLDDHPDNFLENDRTLRKWKAFLKEVEEIQDKNPNLIIIPGEEVSVGNNKNKNVHCLILNDPEFHPGYGDSAENFLQNSPTLTIPELLKKKSTQALAISAHPLEKPPLAQRFILRRGIWDKEDCMLPQLDALQILNDNSDFSLNKSMTLWKDILLTGRKIGISAGNDAHGNFNCYRQIDIPFLSMKYHQQHLLGKARTAVLVEKFTKRNLLEALKNHQNVISTGPLAIFQLEGKGIASIGHNYHAGPGDKIKVFAKSIPEYGFWREINLFFGQYLSKDEKRQQIPIQKNKLFIKTEFNFPSFSVDYIRLEAFTDLDNLCFSNPIWIEKS
jgi:hypothetical protein